MRRICSGSSRVALQMQACGVMICTIQLEVFQDVPAGHLSRQLLFVISMGRFQVFTFTMQPGASIGTAPGRDNEGRILCQKCVAFE